MAKVAKAKKRDVSVHSRAARRGESGSDNAKAVSKRPSEESDYKPWLHSTQNAGVGKKKSKPLSRQQRVRQQKGLEKAEINLDKLDKKVSDSKSREKKVNARRIGWDELNEKLPGGGARSKKSIETGEDSRLMEDVVAPDALQLADGQGTGLLGSGENTAQRPNAQPAPHPTIPAPPPPDEDVDEIT